MIDHRTVIAAAIANARGNRRGVPTIVNILDILPQKLLEEVLDDADAVLDALSAALATPAPVAPVPSVTRWTLTAQHDTSGETWIDRAVDPNGQWVTWEEHSEVALSSIIPATKGGEEK